MISVIICTYNRSATLRSALRSIREMSVPTGMSWELIVVDNNSTDDTRRVVESFSATSGLPLRYLFEGNQGLSFARNLGLEEAKGDIIAFTDDDVTVDANWLGRLASAFEARGCIGVAGKIVPVWTSGKPPWMETAGPYRLMAVIPSFDLGEEPCEIETPPFGANMAFRKAAFERYGLFRTDLGRASANRGLGEDTEFGRRLIRAKERLLYAPQAVVYHPVDPERAEKSYFQSWYFNYGRTLARNSVLSHNGTRRLGPLGSLCWSLAAGLGKWAVATNPRRRFYYKLELYRVAGEMVEALKTGKTTDP